MTTADIDRVADGPRALHRQAEGARHIAHMHEVAALLPVLEHQRRLAVQQARAEIRQHTSIRI